MHLVAGLVMAAAAAAATRGRPAELVVTPHCDGQQGALSSVTIGEAKLPWSNDEEDLARMKAALGERPRKVRILGEVNTPYRCIGGLIFALQRLGVSRLDFVTDARPKGGQAR
jgi:hypothetical protein